MRNKFLILLLLLCFIPDSEESLSKTEIPAEILDRTGHILIIIITTPLLVYVLLISLIGHRMKRTGIRWFTINLCIWGLVHMAYISSYWVDTTDNNIAPFPNWFTFQLWDKYGGRFIETMTRSVFSFGVVFLLLEKMILICAPQLEDNYIFNGIFAAIFLIFQNGIFLKIFHYQSIVISGHNMCAEPRKDIEYIPEPGCYWYFPIELFGMVTFVGNIIWNVIYFLFCLIGSCCCCYSLTNYKKTKKKVHHFVEMWLLYFYATVPVILNGAAFGYSVIRMVMTKFLFWIIDNNYLGILTGSGPPTNPPPTSDPNSSPSNPGTPPPPSLINFNTIMEIANLFTSSMKWCIALLPLVEVLMSLFFFQMYREQLFFLLSCGNLFSRKPIQFEESESMRHQHPGVIRMPLSSSEHINLHSHSQISTIITVTSRDIEKTTVEKQPPGNNNA